MNLPRRPDRTRGKSHLRRLVGDMHRSMTCADFWRLRRDFRPNALARPSTGQRDRFTHYLAEVGTVRSNVLFTDTCQGAILSYLEGIREVICMRLLSTWSILALLVAAPVAQASAQSREKIDVSKLGPQVGERVPDFRLTDQHGNVQTLQSVMGPNGLMLVFYRSADW